MLDTTNSRLSVIGEGDRPGQENPWREGISFRTFLEKARQRRHMMMVLTLVGAAVGWLAGLAYATVKVSAFSASSELLISNTNLQLSGPDAVVDPVWTRGAEWGTDLVRVGIPVPWRPALNHVRDVDVLAFQIDRFDDLRQ